MTEPLRRLDFGRVSVFVGAKSGEYPDGNQVVVRGSDTRAVFDTPLVANRIGREFDDAELVILGHAHEDHMAGLHRVAKAAVQVHESDLDAVRSWEGLQRHYGLSASAAGATLHKIQREFFYAPRPDATGYRDGTLWELGGSRVRAIHMPSHTSSLAAFRRTLARVADVPAAVWVTAHHRGVYTERLLGMLGGGQQTLDELVAKRLIYPPEYDEIWIDAAERRTIAQHLDELLAAGRVTTDGQGRFARA